jgi:nucleotide-binding universal stress UspA family protein
MTEEMAQRPGVVVGIDGSDASLAAFAHAAWEADRRGLPLYLVHCVTVPASVSALGLGPDPEEAVAGAAERLADLAEQALAAYPDLLVRTAVVAGQPGAALVQASRHAALLVVGSRGLGGFTGLLLGSVGAQLAAHSAAPLIVIRQPYGVGELGAPPSRAPVLVGVDGVPDSEAAIDFAFAEASARGAPVVVLYAWWMLPVARLQPDPIGVSVEPNLIGAEEEARRMLAEATAGVRAEYPDVEVTLLPARAMNPVLALLEASAGAGLLVVSRHGGNVLTRLLFSSIGDVAVRQAACPVAVVPERSTHDVPPLREPVVAGTVH